MCLNYVRKSYQNITYKNFIKNLRLKNDFFNITKIKNGIKTDKYKEYLFSMNIHFL